MSKVDYCLMYVTDERLATDDDFLQVLESSLKGGATIVQLREKKLDTNHFYKRAVESKNLCIKYGIPLIINDRLDIALAVDAVGV
ncbi:MAG: thiamine phosphate synthase, partial [Ekhidna sp.]|nr:thiamine phosphate synthase [Ekhidna sp.]